MHVLILVGVPGSGKTTLSKLLAASGWLHVNQDELGNRRACEDAFWMALQQRRHVVVDRCNIDEGQRAHWVRLARESRAKGVTLVALQLLLPLEVCKQRAAARTDHPTLGPHNCGEVIGRFAQDYVGPSRSEGFARVLTARSSEEAEATATDLIHEAGPVPLLDAAVDAAYHAQPPHRSPHHGYQQQQHGYQHRPGFAAGQHHTRVQRHSHYQHHQLQQQRGGGGHHGGYPQHRHQARYQQQQQQPGQNYLHHHHHEQQQRLDYGHGYHTQQQAYHQRQSHEEYGGDSSASVSYSTAWETEVVAPAAHAAAPVLGIQPHPPPLPHPYPYTHPYPQDGATLGQPAQPGHHYQGPCSAGYAADAGAGMACGLGRADAPGSCSAVSVSAATMDLAGQWTSGSAGAGGPALSGDMWRGAATSVDVRLQGQTCDSGSWAGVTHGSAGQVTLNASVVIGSSAAAGPLLRGGPVIAWQGPPGLEPTPAEHWGDGSSCGRAAVDAQALTEQADGEQAGQQQQQEPLPEQEQVQQEPQQQQMPWRHQGARNPSSVGGGGYGRGHGGHGGGARGRGGDHHRALSAMYADPRVKISQDDDPRVILLFDLNGTLTSHTSVRKAQGITRLRPGTQHLLKLKQHFRLGIYTSSTVRTVQSAIELLEGAVGGQQLFERRLVLHREHTAPAPPGHVDSGGDPWDTLKPLGLYFTSLHRVILVDDDAYKSITGEESNMLLVPCWRDEDVACCVLERLCQLLLTTVACLDKEADVRHCTTAVSSELRAAVGAAEATADTERAGGMAEAEAAEALDAAASHAAGVVEGAAAAAEVAAVGNCVPALADGRRQQVLGVQDSAEIELDLDEDDMGMQ